MEKFKVNENCINCRACERVAKANFKIENNIAVVYKQPENETELKSCNSALDICPTSAIEITKPEVIIGESKVRETLEKYPKLKDKLQELSPKFKTMQNPVMWNTVARFATFKDTAKMTGVSLCEILHFINKELGVESLLMKEFPNCIKETDENEMINSAEITWKEPNVILRIDDDNSEAIIELVEKVKKLNDGESLVFESNSVLRPIVGIIEDMGLSYNLIRINPQKVRISIYKRVNEDWKTRKEEFEELDVRKMKNDPFDEIIKKAYSVKEEEGFTLIQTFVPDPMLSMLSEMGFEYEINEKEIGEVRVYLHKKKIDKTNEEENDSEKPAITIQSATPVGYPIIMKLLQSEKIRNLVSIKELKVWEETEKHLGWIANGKADISFSSVITASKLKNNDVKMPIVFVWDNFSILTRGYKAKGLEDLKGKQISVPLFEDAPPAKITKYLIQAKGYDINDYNFVYGKPFGRPNQIMADFIEGKVDTVLLREPEASFALKGIEGRGIEYSELSYGDLWNEVNEDFGLFPNAGVVFKGEFVRNHPEIVKIIAEELEEAIKWLNQNKKDAAKLSFGMMRKTQENVEFFLERVTFEYKSGDELVEKVQKFYQILVDQKIINTAIDDELLDMFRL